MTQQDQMTPQERSNLRLRRAGLAATVVLGCSLITVSEVPGLAASSSNPSQTTTPQASASAQNLLDLPISERASHGILNPLAPINASGEPAASATRVNGSTTTPTTGTLPGLTPMTSGTTTAEGTSSSGFSTVTGPVSSASVPAIMAQAYQNAATHAAATCHIPATLLASIGQVESGNLAGEKITTDHRAYPGVWGPELNGNGYEAIPDTDNGTLDGDTTWDRAVGPMQFIPSTWRLFAVDGDGDGKTDPQNVYDAASTAANYLCYGGRDLSTTAGVSAAVLSYNHSDAYLALVLKWKQSFDTGTSFSQLQTVAALPNTAPKVVVVRKYQVTVPKLPTTQATATPAPTSRATGSKPTTTARTTAPGTTTSKATSTASTPTAKPTAPVTTSPSATSKPTSPVTSLTSSAPTSSSSPTTSKSSGSTTPSSRPTSAVVTDATTGLTAQASGRTLRLVAPATGSHYQWTVRDADKGSIVSVPSGTTAHKLVQSFAVGRYVVGLTYTDAKGATVTDKVTVVLGNGTVSFVTGNSTHKVSGGASATPTPSARVATSSSSAKATSGSTSSATSSSATSSSTTSGMPTASSTATASASAR